MTPYQVVGELGLAFQTPGNSRVVFIQREVVDVLITRAEGAELRFRLCLFLLSFLCNI